jgi:hypothetical protein
VKVIRRYHGDLKQISVARVQLGRQRHEGDWRQNSLASALINNTGTPHNLVDGSPRAEGQLDLRLPFVLELLLVVLFNDTLTAGSAVCLIEPSVCPDA